MNFEAYKQLLMQRLERYFDFFPENIFSDFAFDIAALYSKRDTQTVLFKENIIDYYDSNEVCLVQKVSSSEEILSGLSLLKKRTESFVVPDRHHKSTIVTHVFVVENNIENMDEIIKKLKRYRHSHLFKAGFNGWAESFAVLVNLESGAVVSGWRARYKRKFFKPEIQE